MKRWMNFEIGLISLLGTFFLGCDADIKSTILTGVQSGSTTIATALITAFFQRLEDTTTTMLMDGVYRTFAMIM
jgi:hypothetical protein